MFVKADQLYGYVTPPCFPMSSQFLYFLYIFQIDEKKVLTGSNITPDFRKRLWYCFFQNSMTKFPHQRSFEIWFDTIDINATLNTLVDKQNHINIVIVFIILC